MYENQVWSLVDPPKGVRPYEHQWKYKQTQMKLFTSIKLDLLQSGLTSSRS
jgi:hypothetical protein